MSFNDLERGTNTGPGTGNTSRNSRGPLPLYHAPRSAADAGGPAVSEEQSAEYKRLADGIGAQIFKINSNTVAIRKLVSLAGSGSKAQQQSSQSQSQSQDWTKRAHDLVESTRTVVKATTPLLKQLTDLVAGGATTTTTTTTTARTPATATPPQWRLHASKLQRDFEAALQGFSEAQKQSARRTKEELDGARRVVAAQAGQAQTQQPQPQPQSQRSQRSQQQLVALDEEEQQQQHGDAAAAAGDHVQLQSQTQAQAQKQSGPSQAELEFQESLIAERETSIREIESGIHELNEIFRDLGQIVTEQGGMIDNIEYNIDEIADNTRGADRELVQAHEYQRKAGRRAACLLLIVGFVVAVVLLAILS